MSARGSISLLFLDLVVGSCAPRVRWLEGLRRAYILHMVHTHTYTIRCHTEAPVEPGRLEDLLDVLAEHPFLEPHHEGGEIVVDPTVTPGALLAAAHVIHGRAVKVDVDAQVLPGHALDRLERGLASFSDGPCGCPAVAVADHQHARAVVGEKDASGDVDG